MKTHTLGIVTLALLVAACGSNGSTTSDGGASEGGGTGDGGGDGASSGALGFTPSNFDPGTLDLTNLPDIDVTQGCSPIGSDGGGFNCGGSGGPAKYTLITQANQIKVGIHVAHSWRIEPNAILQVSGPYPIILVATDKIEILGGLAATGNVQFPGAGGYRDPNMGDMPGGGPGGGGAGMGMGFMGTGAGGGSYCGIGGSGAVNAGSAAMGGMVYGTPEIVPLVGGSSGGEGFGDGGGGGGAIQLVAANSVTVDAMGYVTAGGGGGNGGGQAGGGGSGGAILIESQNVTIAGALAVNGGGGGQGTNSLAGGKNALPSNMPAAGGTDMTNLSQGGNGSAGATVNGANGNTSPMQGEGGGGGGAGRIRINTKSGMATLTGATLSPDATTACTTQGMLH